MLEQMLFITGAVIIFSTMFLKMIKKNDTAYIIVLIMEAIGIIIDALFLIMNLKRNVIFNLLIYSISIVFPLIIIVLEKKNIDIINVFKFAKAKFYIKNGNFKKAKEILINITEKNQKNYKAHKMLADIYEKEGGIRKAIDEYVICIEINKKDYDSYYKVAILLNELDKKDEAIEMLYNLIDKKPDFLNATITLSDLLIEKESYKDAVSVLTEAIKNNPESYELNFELGIAYTMLNDFKKAKECYEMAAEINSLMYNAKYSLAQIALLYKNLDEAEEYFEQTIEDEELSADSYYELAKIKLMRGDKELSIKFGNIAIELREKKICDKIKNEPLFITIMTKLSMPFNFEDKENTKEHLKAIEEIAKVHLENTTDITTNMGYANNKSLEEKGKNISLDLERNN